MRTKASRTRSRSTRPVDYVAVAIAYAEDAVQDRRKYGRWVRLSAKRFLADLKHAQTKRPRFVWSADQANRACEFIGLLPHVEGSWDSLTIRLEPAQVFFLCSLFGFRNADGSRRFTTALFAVGRKNGKALALDTPIPTPDGWRRIAEIEAGDQVFGADGRAYEVEATSEVFIGEPCYRLTFSDGTSVVASGDHLWLTRHRFRPWACARVTGSGNGGRPRMGVVTTEQIAVSVRTARADGGVEYNHGIAVAAPLDTPSVDLPLDPYLLGAWLGDGATAAARLTCGDEDVGHFVAEVQRVVGGEPVRRRDHTAWALGLTTGRGGRREVKVQAVLRRLGVLGDKHVPEAYLWAGTEQRRSLLQGLMDTDGTITPTGRSGAVSCDFTSTRRALAEGVLQLVRSLGMKATLLERFATLNGRNIGACYRVQFTAGADDAPFRLARKAARLPASVGRRSRTLKIIACEPVDSVPTRCLKVGSPDRLFLCGPGMTATHNSALAAAILLYVFCTEPELGPQVLSAATTGSQARIVWGVAKRMVEKTPALREAFSLEPFANAIARYEVGGTFRPINAKASSQDGLNPSALCFDELHAHKTRDLYDVLRSAAGARKSPLFLYTTTEGYESPGPWAEVRTFMRQVLEGVVDADHFLAVYYALDEDDDDFDESKWIKANPLLGISVSLSELRKHAIEAQQQPGALAEFRIKRLNRQAAAAEGFIDLRGTLLGAHCPCRHDGHERLGDAVEDRRDLLRPGALLGARVGSEVQDREADGVLRRLGRGRPHPDDRGRRRRLCGDRGRGPG